MFGSFGYELDLTGLSKDEQETVKRQIVFYKKYRKLLQFGTFYRLGEAFEGETSGFICINENKSLAVATLAWDKRWFNRNATLRLKGLDESAVYEVSYRAQDNYSPKQSFLTSGELLMNVGISTSDFLQDCSAERSANSVYSRCLVLKKAGNSAKKV